MKSSKRRGVIAIAVVLCAAWVAARQNPPQPSPGAGRGQAAGQAPGQARGRGARTKKVVLAWADTRNGVAQHDSITHALSQLERIGYESGTYDLYIRTDSNIVSFNPKKTDGTAASGGPSLSNVDAIVFAGHRNVPLDDAGKADLITAIRDQGKGFVALFIGLTPWDTFPEMANILGAKYVGHSPFGSQPSTLINESPDFPATRHIPQVWTTPDPYYQPTDYSREKMQVLLRLDVSKYAPVSGYTRTDGDYPVAWAKMYGKGRVFYSSIGNGGTQQWDSNDLLRMYFEAIKWSLGLTPYELKPHPLPADARPPQGPPAAAQPGLAGRGRVGMPSPGR